MSQTASGRYLLRAAPGGLALVQDLLNTRPNEPHRIPDLLASREDAQAWAAQASRRWAEENNSEAPTMDLTSADLKALRELRSTFNTLVGAGETRGRRTSTPATLVAGDDGVVRLVPVGTGADWFASALWLTALLAQQDGTWPRLKQCRNDVCATAFYDHSRNNSGVWHNVHTCGNTANLRASRERKRARAAQQSADPRT